jgi:CIC family chloride channel protein
VSDQQTASTLSRFHDEIKRSSHIYMVLVALIVGVLGGYGAVAFRWLIHWIQDSAWATKHWDIAYVNSLPWYVVVGVPALGGLVCGSIVSRFAPEAKGHGVPEVMEAVALRGGRIRPRVVIAKAMASSVSIGTGGSVGREGPIVQIGSAIGSTVGQVLGMSQRRLRTMVGCGAAAGIAATFNAPVAGALFAVEVILGDFGVPQFSPIVISSVMATVVARHELGDLPAFEIPKYALQSPAELGIYAVLGLLAGLLALAFVKLLYKGEDLADAVPWPVPLKAMLGGAMVGGLALIAPGVLGVGYESMNDALTGSPTALMLLFLLGAKLLAVTITLASGGSGGIFAPSLFLGATLGALVGTLAHSWLGDSATLAAPGAYALVGMGAMVGATTHAPISAILILFELTNDYRIILPLMVSCILATLFASRLQAASIYTLKLLRRGVNVMAGQDINVLRGFHVHDVMHSEPATLSGGTRLGQLATRLAEGSTSCLYQVDADGRLQGVISMSELQPLLDDLDVLRNLVTADEISDHDAPRVDADSTLDEVLEKLDLGYRDELPVVDGERLVGVVRIEDVIRRYKRELLKRELAQSEDGEPPRAAAR